MQTVRSKRLYLSGNTSKLDAYLMNEVYHIPNAETRHALDEIKRGKYAGTIDTSSIEAMIKSIEA